MDEPEARREYIHEVDADSKGNLEPFEKWFARRRPTKSAPAGFLVGLSFWKRDLHQLFRQDILNTVGELSNLDSTISGLPLSELRRYAKWAQTLENQINDVKLVVEEGEAFFGGDNIEALRLLEPDLDRSTRGEVSEVLDQLKKASFQ